ncbi:MAG: ABC transporter permease, partial [Chloroflexi bacterium]|nr:ABC transporter permease [Chloroflexota bacterium]
MSTATDVLAEVDVPVHRGPSRLQRLWRMARQRPLGAFGAVIIFILVVTAVFGQDITVGGETIVPGFAPYKAEETNIVDKLKGPSWSHIAGTDELGRDIFTRIIYGARTAMIIGLAATGIGIAIGTLIGTISAYIGGFWDLGVQRISDAMQALPPLVLMMVLVTMMSPGIGTVVFVIVIFLVPGTQRVNRGTVLSLKEFTYIEAARTIGASSPRIVLRHIMP